MTYLWQRWLADEFRAAGLDVVEVEGWKNRGRPASTGHFDPEGASTAHHTGVLSSKHNPAPGLSVLVGGRSDLPGPLCHWATAYDGKIYVIAAGRANHAGRVGKAGESGMPLGSDGNSLALGNEVITNGTQALPKAQREAIAIAHAVVLLHFSKNKFWVHRHEDISATGKWDLGQIGTSRLRDEVQGALNKLKAKKYPPRVKAALENIRKEIRRLKAARKRAKKLGEPTSKYTVTIKNLRKARRSLKKVNKR